MVLDICTPSYDEKEKYVEKMDKEANYFTE